MHGKYFLSLLLIPGDPPISVTGLPEGSHNFTVDWLEGGQMTARFQWDKPSLLLVRERVGH